jgi:hypothetical protein
MGHRALRKSGYQFCFAERIPRLENVNDRAAEWMGLSLKPHRLCSHSFPVGLIESLGRREHAR